MRSILAIFTLLVTGLLAGGGCTDHQIPYGREESRVLPTRHRQVWAVAPVINLSGEHGVDPFLQADLVFQQLQQVRGVTVVPVNRVAEVYVALRIDRISSPEQAALVCDLLQCDGLLVPTVTIYDPYNPPKFGGSVQLFVKPGTFVRPPNVDPRDLAKRATPKQVDPMPTVAGDVIQVVGMFDAANGSVRERLHAYAAGRHDPVGPLGEKEYYVRMERYCGFAYSELIEQLIASPKLRGL
ncbi:MAG TPA: hypothetical protein VH475_23020 [Tepidisphaeraceae bacterium]|jgi:hypothetical protein